MKMAKLRVAVGAAAHRLIVDPVFVEECQEHRGLERLTRSINRRVEDWRSGGDGALGGRKLTRRSTT